MHQPSQSTQIGQSDADRTPALLFATANDLPRETREPVVRRLNLSLADTTDLMTQMKTAHWNVKGIHFYQLHLLFDEIAETLEEHADMLAERATSLGGQAEGTVRVAARESRIPELDAGVVTGEELLRATVDNLAVHAATVRADIDFAASYGDESTADLYTEISREIDQQVYFLESHLQTRPVDTIAERGAGQPVESTQPIGADGAQPSAASPTSPPKGAITYRDSSHPGREPFGQQVSQGATFPGDPEMPSPGQGEFR